MQNAKSIYDMSRMPGEESTMRNSFEYSSGVQQEAGAASTRNTAHLASLDDAQALLDLHLFNPRPLLQQEQLPDGNRNLVVPGTAPLLSSTYSSHGRAGGNAAAPTNQIRRETSIRGQHDEFAEYLVRSSQQQLLSGSLFHSDLAIGNALPLLCPTSSSSTATTTRGGSSLFESSSVWSQSEPRPRNNHLNYIASQLAPSNFLMYPPAIGSFLHNTEEMTRRSNHATSSSSTPNSKQEQPTSSTTLKNKNSTATREQQQRFRPFHEEKWKESLKQLRAFKAKYGHCLVPHTFPDNQNLARWVKRQRRQYKLMLVGDATSTMTQERVDALNDEGFIWDSHDVVWRERYNQLIEYKAKYGHTKVPTCCKDYPSLAGWVKCQRRQYKLMWEKHQGEKQKEHQGIFSNSMSPERIQLLESIGFTWEVVPRRTRRQDEPKRP